MSAVGQCSHSPTGRRRHPQEVDSAGSNPVVSTRAPWQPLWAPPPRIRLSAAGVRVHRPVSSAGDVAVLWQARRITDPAPCAEVGFAGCHGALELSGKLISFSRRRTWVQIPQALRRPYRLTRRLPVLPPLGEADRGRAGRPTPGTWDIIQTVSGARLQSVSLAARFRSASLARTPRKRGLGRRRLCGWSQQTVNLWS